MFSEIGSPVALQCIFTIGLAFCHSGSDIKDVKRFLFSTQQYDKDIRPMKDQLMTMNISVYFHLNSIIDFDDENEALITACTLAMQWTDEYLQWNSTEFNDTEYIILPQDNIWKPDILLKNSIAPFKAESAVGSSILNVFVHNTGIIQWYPYQVLQSSCDVDIRYIPFDVQTCTLLFTARSYVKFQVNLVGMLLDPGLEEYQPNSMWDIQSTAARWVDTDNSEVDFEIKLKRKPAFFIINIIVPVILLAILNTFTFVLPITSGERASFSVTLFLSMAVFLTIFAESLPKNSDSVSLLSIYLILMTVSSTLIVVLCLVEARLATRNTTDHPIGNGFLTLYKCANILRCKSCRCRRVELVLSLSCGHVNWIDIVDSMDVLLFILFFTLNILSVVVIFAIDASHLSYKPFISLKIKTIYCS